MSTTKLLILFAFIASTVFVHFRGRTRLSVWRQVTDHSAFMAPINCFIYLFSKVPARPFLPLQQFGELQPLIDHWPAIREEALRLSDAGRIRASAQFDDVGFNSFFKNGWKRFYLKWYDHAHPSALALCPFTTALVQQIPTIKAAMFAALPPGGRLNRHRDPYAGSLRYHLGLVTPNDDRCWIEVDGQRYSWRDGQAVVFDETYVHSAANETDVNRIILFCDIERPMSFGFAAAINQLLGRFLVRTAAAANDSGDRVGGLNQVFRYFHAARLQGKRLKTWNRKLYYAAKWLFFGGLLVLWLTH